jgi:hypothetical protein
MRGDFYRTEHFARTKNCGDCPASYRAGICIGKYAA